MNHSALYLLSKFCDHSHTNFVSVILQVMLEGVGRAVCLRYSTSCNQPFFRAGGDGGGGSRRRGGSPGRGDSRHGRRGDFPVLEESQCRELLSRLSSQKDEKTTEFIEDFRQNGTGPPNALLTIDRRLRYMHVSLRLGTEAGLSPTVRKVLVDMLVVARDSGKKEQKECCSSEERPLD